VNWINVVFGARNLDFAVSGIGPPSNDPPPTLTGVSPGTVLNSGNPEVTLTGTNLDTVVVVNVGSMAFSTFTQRTPTQLKFIATSPTIIGMHGVTATNGGGTSNGMPLTIAGTHPAILSGSAFAVRGAPTTFNLIGDQTWMTVWFASPSNVPSVLPGFVSFGIGNNFAELLQLVTLITNNRGQASLTLTFPTSMPAIPVYFQTVNLDPFAPVLPLETSNVHGIAVL
jgi:hypothetical protein